jgi:20S proteasome subunit beta 6
MAEALPLFFTNEPVQNMKEHAKFSPYTNNGGTVIAVAGKYFCVVAGDTRMSEGYSIHTRHLTKLIKLTDKCILATAGMQADMVALHKTLQYRLVMYKHQNGKDMSTPAIAQMLSNILYSKRFFPYYTFNVLGGVDDDGIGCAFSYDAVGSFQRLKYSSSGTGQSLVQPLLDNQVARAHQRLTTADSDSVTAEQVEDLVRDAFNSAGERDIYTGDHVEMYTLSKTGGIKQTKFDLKYD